MHGLAVLAALGVTFTIKLFERAVRETEAVEAELRQSESELRQSEQRFQALVQHATDIIMVIGADATRSLREPGLRDDPRISRGGGGRHVGPRPHPPDRRRRRCASAIAHDARPTLGEQLRSPAAPP